MAHFRFPLSVDVDNKRTSTHVSVNPYAISFQTNDATPVVYDGHEAKSIDLTALSVATAGKLTNARTIGISGAVTGTATNFDGTGNITIPTTAIDVSKANAGTLAIARGGTGKTSWTAFGIVYASAKDTLGQLGVGTAGQVLQSGGSAAPGWIDQADLVVGEAGKLSNGRTILIDLASTTSASFNGTSNITPGVSNTLPTTHGGTGKTAWDSYKIIYASGQNTLAQLDIGSEGEVLLSQGTGKAAKWENQQNLNVGTAAQFTMAKSITLTGDITGTASSVGGWEIPTTIGNGKVTNAMLAGSIANEKLSHYSFTIGTQTIDLGNSINLGTLLQDLGIGRAFRYLGVVNAVPTTNIINGYTCTSGDMVVVSGASNPELDGVYAYDGTSWVKTTNAGAYKVLQNVVSDPTADGSAYSFIKTITQDANGVITATKANLPFATTAKNVGTTSAAGTANTVSRGDHVHAIALATGDSNGQVKIAGTNVSVKGLKSAAYTESTAYAAAGHTHTTLNVGTVGDSYLPVYFNNGGPAVSYPVQYKEWTIASGGTSWSFAHTAYKTNTYVLQIVVTSGEANLNAPISWDTNTNGTLTISTATATSGAVSGYVITARGVALTSS